jgi:hypothetical protein
MSASLDRVWDGVISRVPARTFDDSRERAWLGSLWEAPRLPVNDLESHARARLLATAAHAGWLAEWRTCDPDDRCSLEHLQAHVKELGETIGDLSETLEQRLGEIVPEGHP